MKRTFLVLGVAVLSFAFLGSSFAAVDSIKVSGDITEQAITRDLDLGLDIGDEVDGNVTNAGDNRKEFLLSQVRLRFDADLTEDVSATIGLINERIWGRDDEDTDDDAAAGTTNADVVGEDSEIDLDIAYVTFKEFLYQPLTLIVGRQPLRYGSGLIIGDPDTNQASDTSVDLVQTGDLSMRKSFDAVRAIFDYSPVTLDLIYAKVDEAVLGIEDDVTLFGANLAYLWDAFNGLTEAYYFCSNNSRTNADQFSEDNRNTSVLGVRTQFDVTDHVTLSGEYAYEFGDIYADTDNNQVTDDNRDLKAQALLLGVDYRFLNDFNAKVGASYAMLSGNNQENRSYGGWDPMYEDQTPGEIINLIASATNCMVWGINGSYMPQEDLTLALQFWRAVLLEKFTSSTYTPVIGPASGYSYNLDNDKLVLGNEVDVCALYDYTEDVQFRFNGACFIPSDLLATENQDAAYSIRGGLTVNF